jgi:hypothetical protein
LNLTLIEQGAGFRTIAECCLEQFTKQKKILKFVSISALAVSFVSPKAVFVPNELYFHTWKKNNLLILISILMKNMSLRLINSTTCRLIMYIRFPRYCLRKINFLFPGNRIRHHSSCLIENVVYQIRYGRANVQLVLHIQKDHFEILYFEGESLSFYNSFVYQTWDDLFYYLFFVLEQLGLDAEKLHTMILGEVSIKSEFYKKLRLYVKSLSFGPRSELYKYSDGFDEIPHHYYFNLLNLNSCG